jgi:hypothetical protein
MLRSHAALWESTGSLEMLVFHTLFAGNIGQFGAPGTVVVMTGIGVTGAVWEAAAEGDGDAGADADVVLEVAADASVVLELPGDELSVAAADPAGTAGPTSAAVLAGAVAQPAAAAVSAITAAAIAARRVLVTKCPVSKCTVAS